MRDQNFKLIILSNELFDMQCFISTHINKYFISIHVNIQE